MKRLAWNLLVLVLCALSIAFGIVLILVHLPFAMIAALNQALADDADLVMEPVTRFWREWRR